MSAEWVRTYENGTDYIESLGGVLWADVPLPYPWHRCTPQTRGWFGLDYTERCACGAARMSADGLWMERNETRKARARERREARMPREHVTCTTCGRQYEAIKDSGIARERLCTWCWADAFTASAGNGEQR